MKFLPKISSCYTKKLTFYGNILMPTACRMPTALIGKMPDADGIAKTQHNDQYTIDIYLKIISSPTYFGKHRLCD